MKMRPRFVPEAYGDEEAWDYSAELNPKLATDVTIQLGGSLKKGGVKGTKNGGGGVLHWNIIDGWDIGTYHEHYAGVMGGMGINPAVDFSLSLNSPKELEGAGTIAFAGFKGVSVDLATSFNGAKSVGISFDVFDFAFNSMASGGGFAGYTSFNMGNDNRK